MSSIGTVLWGKRKKVTQAAKRPIARNELIDELIWHAVKSRTTRRLKRVTLPEVRFK